MKSRIHLRSVVLALTLVLGTSFALAHNGSEHMMGTVSAISQTSITVTTTKQATVVVILDSSTKFSRGDSDAAWKDLAVGERVVVNAKPNASKKLVAVSVKWGAGSPSHGGADKKRPAKPEE